MNNEPTVVWLDANIKKDSERRIKLKPFMSHMKTFDDIDDCLDYINMHLNITLIITNELITPSMIALPQIKTIYIHNIDHSRHKCDMLKEFSSKIMGIYDNINQLIRNLLDEDLFPLLPISIINPQMIKETSTRDLTHEQGIFLWFQFLLKILLKMPQTNDSFNEMIFECLNHYENDELERKKILEFQQSYSSDTCIHWYTSDTFLYRLLNKSLRTQNIDEIIKYRYYVQDLYQRLENLSTKENSIIPTIYRGQMITRDELEKLKENINGLISVNTFFSTTLSCNTAAEFSGSGMGRPQLESVVFEITINQKRSEKPFADIHRYSSSTHECEILFSMGTIFRIENVELLLDEIWLIKLTLIEDDDENFKELITHFEKEINETEHYLLILGKFLYLMGDLDKSERYYRLILNQILSSVLSVDDDDYCRDHLIATIYNNLGLIYHTREKFQLALENYHNAMKIHLSLRPMDAFANTTIYNNIANTLIEMGDYEKALEMYNTALELRLLYSAFIEDDPGLAQIYNNIAVCYNQNSQYTRSIENYEKSLDIKLKYLPSNHPSLGITYSNLSNVYRTNSNHEMALKYCQKALDIHRLTLPEDHVDLAKTYNALANIYADIEDSSKAKENYEKALEILLNQTPRKHQLLTTIYSNIASVYLRECQYELAVKYYQRALEKIESSDGVIYSNLGEIYRRIGGYTEALIHYKKAIDIQILLYPLLDHPNLAQSYHGLGTLFSDKGQYDTALEYFELALEIKQNVYIPNHPSIAKTYTNMAETYRKQSNYIESLKYNEKALEIEKQQMPIQNSNLTTVFNNLGLTYLDQKNFLLAMEYFQQTLDLQLQSFDSNHLLFSTTYINMATVYSENEDYTSALAYLQRALNIKQQHLPSNHIEFGLLYNNMGAIYLKAQNFLEARESFKHALGIYLQNSLSNTSEIATIFNNIATLYQLNGEHQLAKENFENSLVFDLKSLPEDHPNIRQTKQQISFIDTLLKE